MSDSINKCVIKEGELMKLSNKIIINNQCKLIIEYDNSILTLKFKFLGEFRKAWQSRYFILTEDGRLTGYKKKPTMTNIIPKTNNNFKIFAGTSIVISDSPRECSFSIKMKKKSETIIRIFSTDNSTDRHDWIISALEAYMKITNSRVRYSEFVREENIQ
ncbi:hypothetical protein A3Q56_08039 [Intoshia linei]|uniref:PH domain-containing protein n=1 Tax=Intoshia linei TaxID=1819745 RepID=A0A177AQJ1_9BILA|nr:hypothetical protein A3Q56_08039 [Intoshia linei]